MEQFTPQFGWLKRPKDVDVALSRMPVPLFGPASDQIKGSGKGQIALLYKAIEKVVGHFNVKVQESSDCTSFAEAYQIDTLRAINIINGSSEEWVAECCTEANYALSRVEVGQRALGQGGGSIGAWCAEAVVKFGTLVRIKYLDKYDLTQYSRARADSWGWTGLPDDLEPIARQYPVKLASLVLTYEESRDAIFNLCPVNVCSQTSFTSYRDKDGFALKTGYNWPHSMAVLAVDDSFRRPGVLLCNSWPKNWITGPKRHEQPDGSFWVDADVFNEMLRQRDSFAYSGLKGFAPRKLNLRLF